MFLNMVPKDLIFGLLTSEFPILVIEIWRNLKQQNDKYSNHIIEIDTLGNSIGITSVVFTEK